MESIGGNIIKRVEDFKYLGSYIKSTDRDVNIRIAKAWAALNSMQSIWKSKLSEFLKRNFFRAAVESVLVYGSVTRNLTHSTEKKRKGAYTRMFRAVMNKFWTDHLTTIWWYTKFSK